MNDRAATFRTADGEIVGTTWGGTLCWYPRKPSSLACVSRDGEREHVIRCGWCPGCLELDRRRLAERLQTHYAKCEVKLWLLILEVGRSISLTTIRKIRRILHGSNRSGLYRLSNHRLALIVAGTKPIASAVASATGADVTLTSVKRTRGLRAWGLLTSGMLVSRDAWGKWTNRFYHRGLPQLERERWAVETRGGLRKRHGGAGQGVRGVRDDVFLFPPLAWLPPRLAHRKGPMESRTRQPERIGTTLANLTSRLRISEFRSDDGRADELAISSPARVLGPALSPRVRRTFAKSGSSILDETRYQGSVNSDRSDLDAWAERMKQKAEARAKQEKPPDG